MMVSILQSDGGSVRSGVIVLTIFTPADTDRGALGKVIGTSRSIAYSISTSN